MTYKTACSSRSASPQPQEGSGPYHRCRGRAPGGQAQSPPGRCARERGDGSQSRPPVGGRAVGLFGGANDCLPGQPNGRGAYRPWHRGPDLYLGILTMMDVERLLCAAILWRSSLQKAFVAGHGRKPLPCIPADDFPATTSSWLWLFAGLGGVLSLGSLAVVAVRRGPAWVARIGSRRGRHRRLKVPRKSAVTRCWGESATPTPRFLNCIGAVCQVGWVGGVNGRP